MMSARKLLKFSFNFLLANPLLFFYGFIYFLPIIVAVVGVVMLAISVGTLSLVTFSLPTIMRTVFGIVFGSFFAVFLMGLFFFTVVVISLSFTAYIQSHLRHGKASIRDSLSKAYTICSTVPWAVAVYLIYLFVNSSPLWPLGLMLFFYVPQLLIDGHSSFFQTFLLSWTYFKKTFWVMLKFFILNSFLLIVLLLTALLSLALAILLVIIPGASLFFSLLSIIIFFGLFLFCIMGSMILIIGINELYLEVKQLN